MIGLLAAASIQWPVPPIQAPWSDFWGKRACALIDLGEEPAVAFKRVMQNDVLGSRWEKQMVDFAKKYGPQEQWPAIVEEQMVMQRLHRCPPENFKK